MTLLGKLFVLINLGLSLMMAFAAVALWGTGIDWQKTAAKGDRPPGRLLVTEQQIDRLRYTRGLAETTWADAWADAVPRREDENKKLLPVQADERGLMFLDERRRARLRLFANELEHLRTRATPAAPGNEVVLSGQLPEIIDPTAFGLPRLTATKDRAGQALLSLRHYEAELKNARDENRLILGEWEKVEGKLTPKKVGDDEKRGDLNKASARHTAETEKITGKDDKGRWVKGLRQRINEDREKREGIIDEINLTRPLFVNTSVESELVRQRYEAMQERIKELKGYLRRHHKVEVDDKGG